MGEKRVFEIKARAMVQEIGILSLGEADHSLFSDDVDYSESRRDLLSPCCGCGTAESDRERGKILALERQRD